MQKRQKMLFSDMELLNITSKRIFVGFENKAERHHLYLTHFNLKETFTFVATPLCEFGIVRVWRKDPDPPPAVPLLRGGFIGSLGQTWDLGCWPSGTLDHNRSLNSCNDMRITSVAPIISKFIKANIHSSNALHHLGATAAISLS